MCAPGTAGMNRSLHSASDRARILMENRGGICYNLDRDDTANRIISVDSTEVSGYGNDGK